MLLKLSKWTHEESATLAQLEPQEVLSSPSSSLFSTGPPQRDTEQYEKCRRTEGLSRELNRQTLQWRVAVYLSAPQSSVK